MWSWFSRKTVRPGTGRSRKRPFRPRLEALEDRCCPSGGAIQWSEALPTSAAVACRATVIQADGKIVAVGQSGAAIGVTRLNPNGTLDTTFNGTGTATLRVNSYTASGTAVAIQPNGQIVVGGLSYTAGGPSDTEFVVARFNADGSLDNSFGKKGAFVSNPGPDMDSVRCLAVLPNGTILAAAVQTNPAGSFAAFELTSAGRLNTAFGSGGFTVVSAAAGASPTGMAVVPGTGQIVLVGSAMQQSMAYGCVVTLTAGGQLDPSFNGTGYVINTAVSANWAVALQGNAASGYKIVVTSPTNGTSSSGDFTSLTRYTMSGTVDTTFGGAGTGSVVLSGIFFTGLAVEGDGSLVGGGTHRYVAADGSIHFELAVGHLSADGVLDTFFGPDGTGFSYAQVGAYSRGVTLAIDPNTGDIVVGGLSGAQPAFLQNAALARFTHP